MSPNRRILLNFVATYGRSLYGMALGLFCGRWALMALGKVDYGLIGVVGGLTAFISFLNLVFASANSRFYAYAIGQAKKSGDSETGLEECRRWFSLAVFIHSIVPMVLMSVGYPVGIWAVRNYLVIPPERLQACVWVFRFVCISCFMSMASVPFNAMYMAKQYIAELTIYTFFTTTLNACFLYYMATHPGDWMARFALWTCLLTVIPQVFIATRALLSFPECKFRRKYCWDPVRLREIASYAGWNGIGAVAKVLRVQGVAILVNRHFGSAVNAAMSFANSVNGHAQTLSGAMQGAFTPVITTAVGAGDLRTAKIWIYRFCKFGMALSLVFMIPLFLELPECIRIWLKDPPEYTVGLCAIMLLVSFVDKQTLGFGVGVMANGRIKWYQIVLGTFNLLTLPVCWLLIAAGGNVYAVGGGMLLTWSMLSYGRLFFARAQLGTSIRKWVRDVMGPVLFATTAAAAVGSIPQAFLPRSIVRIGFTAILSEVVFLPLLWFFALDTSERNFMQERILRRFRHG